MAIRAQLLAGLVAATMLLAGSPALAAPAAEAPSAEAEQPTVGDALESGDLTTAQEVASSAREADPSAENWLAQAKALDAKGDLAGAVDAYQAHLEALGDGGTPEERAQVEQRIEQLREQARGTVADEPASTHREALDQARADREGPAEPPPPEKPLPPPAKDDRVVKKWYFWVTLGAIVAAAGAVTAISIKAAAQEREDALGRGPANPGPGGGGVLFRF